MLNPETHQWLKGSVLFLGAVSGFLIQCGVKGPPIPYYNTPPGQPEYMEMTDPTPAPEATATPSSKPAPATKAKKR